MSHCDACQGLCRIVMFIKVCVSLWGYRWLYHITTLSHGLLQWVFTKRYVALWCLSMVMSHCDICQGLCRIVMFIKVDISLWRYRGLYHITTLSHGSLQWAFNKRYVALWRLSWVMLHWRHSSMVMSHCDICQGLCRIVMFINVDILVWCYGGLYHITIKPWFVTVGV